MSEKQESSQLVEGALREISSSVVELREVYSRVVELMRKSGLLQLAELYENMKNCVEEHTYVYNKVGKKYYYYYLKCKGKTQRSIYIGKSPEGYNRVKAAARLAYELKSRIEALSIALRELSNTVRELELNKAIIGEAVERIKK